MTRVAYWGPGDGVSEDFQAEMRAEWQRRGYGWDEQAQPDAEVVFNFINPDKPKPFRRRQRSTYVTIIHAATQVPDDVLKHEYPLMVRGLANLGMLVVPGDSCHFVTPERGHYAIPYTGDLKSWVREIVDRITPLATSRLVIDNRFEPDLEPELWDGDDLTESLYDAGKRLDALGLLPAPFPLHEIVPEKDRKSVV